MKTFIRRPEVERLTGLSSTTLYEGTQAGWFPKPVKIGPKAVAWDLDEITTWQEERIAQRDGAAA